MEDSFPIHLMEGREDRLLSFREEGIYCAQGDFYIDPWRPVKHAVLTHAHADHARPGSERYLAMSSNASILRLRLGEHIRLQVLSYNESLSINGVKVSFHPAGHIWGSAQVRVEYRGEVWVVSGDYKVEDDGFSGAFEPVPCHTFITESTFGLPIFNWKPQGQVIQEINEWWSRNSAEGKTSIICAYALGKAQRILNNVDHSIGPVFVQGAVANVNAALQENGALLKPYTYVSPELPKNAYPGSLVITPSSALGTSWMRRFLPYEVATVSGWMQVRGIKRRRNAGQGFVLSDHADWKGLNLAVAATGADQVFVTHGYTHAYARWLGEHGIRSGVVQTEYEGELVEAV